MLQEKRVYIDIDLLRGFFDKYLNIAPTMTTLLSNGVIEFHNTCFI